MHPLSIHPAFVAAPESRKWRGGIPDLWEYLTRAAADLAPNWVGVVMPHGARVALRVPIDGPRELVIYRRERHTTKEGPIKWTNELIIFRREFGITAWKPEHAETKEGGPVCTFREVVQTLDFFTGEESPL